MKPWLKDVVATASGNQIKNIIRYIGKDADHCSGQHPFDYRVREVESGEANLVPTWAVGAGGDDKLFVIRLQWKAFRKTLV